MEQTRIRHIKPTRFSIDEITNPDPTDHVSQSVPTLSLLECITNIEHHMWHTTPKQRKQNKKAGQKKKTAKQKKVQKAVRDKAQRATQRAALHLRARLIKLKLQGMCAVKGCDCKSELLHLTRAPTAEEKAVREAEMKRKDELLRLERTRKWTAEEKTQYRTPHSMQDYCPSQWHENRDPNLTALEYFGWLVHYSERAAVCRTHMCALSDCTSMADARTLQKDKYGNNIMSLRCYHHLVVTNSNKYLCGVTGCTELKREPTFSYTQCERHNACCKSCKTWFGYSTRHKFSKLDRYESARGTNPQGWVVCDVCARRK